MNTATKGERSLKRVNEALKAAGYDAMLVRCQAQDTYGFVGPDAEEFAMLPNYQRNSFHVRTIGKPSDWIERFENRKKYLRDERERRKAERAPFKVNKQYANVVIEIQDILSDKPRFVGDYDCTRLYVTCFSSVDGHVSEAEFSFRSEHGFSDYDSMVAAVQREYLTIYGGKAWFYRVTAEQDWHSDIPDLKEVFITDDEADIDAMEIQYEEEIDV